MSTRDEIAKRLAGFRPHRFVRGDVSEPRPEASILLPLVDIEDSLHVAFTLRAAHLTSHAGQVSFPGGKLEAVDDSPEQAAIRETEEEIGLAPESILGRFHSYQSPRGLLVHSYVGWLGAYRQIEQIPFSRQEAEVDEIFLISLERLLDPNLALSTPHERYGLMPEFLGGSHRVWGFSAYVLRHFLDEIVNI